MPFDDKLKNSNLKIKDKRKSLEILSKVINHPSSSPFMEIQNNTHTEVICVNPSPFVQIQNNIHPEDISTNKENNGILTQKFNALKKNPQSLCPTKISDFNLMGLLFKQQIHFQKQEDVS